MTGHVMFMADLLPDALKDSGASSILAPDNSGFRQTAIIIGAILLVALAVMLWAIFIRKPQPSSISGRGLERGMLLTNAEMKGQRSSRSFFGFGKRRKHRHRRSRSRNPTLAETGGLPPVRENEPSQDSTP